MKLLINLIFISFLITFTSCEEESISTLETKTPIVAGYIFGGQTIDSIRVTQSNSYAGNDSTLITLDDLNVKISDGATTFELTNIEGGYYQNLEVIIEFEQSYTIEFEHNNDVVFAETYVPQKREASIQTNEISMEKIEFTGGIPTSLPTFPDPVEVSWENSEGDYYYVVVQNIEDNPEYVNSRLEDPDFDNQRFTFTSEPQIMGSYTIDPRREIQQFGTHQVIVFRVNPEYAALYETSGNSSLSLAQPPTNIENGLGVFTGVSSDTLVLEVKKI
jgi:hypothetical protein